MMKQKQKPKSKKRKKRTVDIFADAGGFGYHTRVRVPKGMDCMECTGLVYQGRDEWKRVRVYPFCSFFGKWLEEKYGKPYKLKECRDQVFI